MVPPKPFLMPHHKGRKRLHLGEHCARVGFVSDWGDLIVVLCVRSTVYCAPVWSQVTNSDFELCFLPELKESLTRMGADIKARVIESVKRTWKTINDFALAHRTNPQEVMEQEVNSVISEMTREEEDRLETGCKFRDLGGLPCRSLWFGIEATRRCADHK